MNYFELFLLISLSVWGKNLLIIVASPTIRTFTLPQRGEIEETFRVADNTLSIIKSNSSSLILKLLPLMLSKLQSITKMIQTRQI